MLLKTICTSESCTKNNLNISEELAFLVRYFYGTLYFLHVLLVRCEYIRT